MIVIQQLNAIFASKLFPWKINIIIATIAASSTALLVEVSTKILRRNSFSIVVGIILSSDKFNHHRTWRKFVKKKKLLSLFLQGLQALLLEYLWTRLLIFIPPSNIFTKICLLYAKLEQVRTASKVLLKSTTLREPPQL